MKRKESLTRLAASALTNDSFVGEETCLAYDMEELDRVDPNWDRPLRLARARRWLRMVPGSAGYQRVLAVYGESIAVEASRALHTNPSAVQSDPLVGAKIENEQISAPPLERFTEFLNSGFAKAQESLRRIVGSTAYELQQLAALAPVASLGDESVSRVQLPLQIYFRESLQLEEQVLQTWSESTLSIQKRKEGIYFSLHNAPEAWGLAISVDQQRPVELNRLNRTLVWPYVSVNNDTNTIALFPFEPSSPPV